MVACCQKKKSLISNKVILLLSIHVELFTYFLYKIYCALQLLTIKDSGLSGAESEMYKELEMQVSICTKNKHHFTRLIYSNLWLKALVVLNGLARFVIKSRNLINIRCTCTRVTNINFLCNYLKTQSREKLTRSNRMITNAQEISNPSSTFFTSYGLLVS